MGKVEWIKLATQLPNDSKIRFITAQKDGYAMAWLWVQLLCLAGEQNDKGQIYVAPGIPYTAATLAAVYSMPKRAVTSGLKLFQDLGMIHWEDYALVITNWASYQNVEGMERIKGNQTPEASPLVPEEAAEERRRAASRESSRRYRDRHRDAGTSVTRDTVECHAAVTRDEKDGHGDTIGNHAAVTGDALVTVTGDIDDRHGDTRMSGDRDQDGKKETREDKKVSQDLAKPSCDFQKKLGIDDAYKRGSRARRKTADILATEITKNGFVKTGAGLDLFDAIEEALHLGFSVDGVMQEAQQCRGDAARFVSGLMTIPPY